MQLEQIGRKKQANNITLFNRFFCKYIIDANVYMGEGESEYRAKQHAAQLALTAIHQQSDCDSWVFTWLTNIL